MRCTRAGGDVGFEVNVKRARRVNLVVSCQIYMGEYYAEQELD
jgi:hypothetical protein